MSTSPQPPPSTRMPAWLKWLLGLTVGCFVLVIACCLGSCLLGKATFGDLIAKAQRSEEQRALSRAAEERVEFLDSEFPPRLPEDVAEAQLAGADVERYLGVRRALEPEAAALQAVIDGALPQQGGALGVARGVVGLVTASMDATEARKDLLLAAEPALRAEGIGPTDLARLAEIVEWRFLRRPEATFLGLPVDERREYLQMKLEERALAAWTAADVSPGLRVNDRTKAEAEQDLLALRDRLAAMERRAAGATALGGVTLHELTARRAELEALPADGLQALAPLTAAPPLVNFTSGRNVSFGRHGQWSTGDPEDSGDLEEDAPWEDGGGPEAGDPQPDVTAPAP